MYIHSSLKANHRQLDVAAAFDKAKSGDNTAQMEVAFYYLNGEHFTQSYSNAAYWFKKAAEGGRAEAQVQVALMYFSGNGVPESRSQAVFWLGRAADQNYYPALDLLRWMTQAAH